MQIRFILAKSGPNINKIDGSEDFQIILDQKSLICILIRTENPEIYFVLVAILD
jgi:hypothetical protein